MKLLQQEFLGDCAPACLAMVSGESITWARRVLGATMNKGINDEVLIAGLETAGIPAVSSLVWPSFDIPAILTVPSLNHPGLLHNIVWSGCRYLDPSNEVLRYPDDSPVVGDKKLEPQWASVILLFGISREEWV